MRQIFIFPALIVSSHEFIFNFFYFVAIVRRQSHRCRRRRRRRRRNCRRRRRRCQRWLRLTFLVAVADVAE